MKVNLLKGILLICCMWVSAVALAAPTDFIEGKHYNKLPLKALENPVIDELRKELKPGQVRVLEFFSYGCIWCYRLDPALGTWQKTKADNIQFERVPVVFQTSWQDLTKAYYTAESLQILDKVHEPLFKAIHANHFDTSKPNALKTFFVEQGVEPKAFDETFASFSVDRKLKWAESMGHVFKVTRIPSIAILTSDEVYLTAMSMVGSEEKLIELINHFAKEAQDKVNQGA
jgi:protein dithiol oxidoreductase (disulfide-forming)